MNENELHERYIRLAFQYESAIDALLARGLVDEEAADAAKERFYDTLNEEKLRTTQKVRDYHETISLYMRMLAHDGMVSLTELARQYSDESPGYVIKAGCAAGIHWSFSASGNWSRMRSSMTRSARN